MFHKVMAPVFIRASGAINVVDEQPEGGDIDPHLRYSQPVNVLKASAPCLYLRALQRFRIKPLAVLMANACGSSALWDEAGNLLFVPIAVRYCERVCAHSRGLARRYHSITLRCLSVRMNHVAGL